MTETDDASAKNNVKMVLNGSVISYHDAKIDICDMGFLCGDGVYEVILVHKGNAIDLAGHVTRLQASLTAIGMANFAQSDACKHETIKEQISGIIQPTQTCGIRIQISSGLGKVTGSRAVDCGELGKPTIAIFQYNAYNSKAYQGGNTPINGNVPSKKAITMSDPRWKLRNIKSTSLMGRIIADNEAIKMGVDDVIFTNEINGKPFVSEATRSNVFAVFDGDKIVTPPADENILHGITRQRVIDLLKKSGTIVEERLISQDELLTAKEVFMTSSAALITSIAEINGIAIGAAIGVAIGKKSNHNIAKRVNQLYVNFLNEASL